MATTLYHLRSTTSPRTELDLRRPLRAALTAVMRAAQFVNGTAGLDGEAAAGQQRRQRAYDDGTASAARERLHYVG